MSYKVCTKCKVLKSSGEFHKHNQMKDGLHPRCKPCKQSHYNYRSEEYKEERRNYYRKNVDKIRPIKAANTAMRRAKIVSATIPGYEKAIKKIYVNCPKGYEVDHIIPLNGENVSGLHVPWNLQVIPMSDNRSKGNKLGG